MVDAADAVGDDRHPFGPGSHAVLSDPQEMPACYPVKGNVRDDGRRYYHRPDSRDYEATAPEVWFDAPTTAEAAGFELSPSHPAGSTGDAFEPGGDGHPCTGQEVELNRLTAAGITVAPALPPETPERRAALGDADDARPGQLAADPDRHPYGVGSHAPLADPSEMPRFYPVKGAVQADGARWYHRADSTAYRRTDASVWFDSPTAAEAAGFELADSHPPESSGVDFEPGGSEHGWTMTDVRSARRAALSGAPSGSPALDRGGLALGAAGVAATAADVDGTPDTDTDTDADADGEHVADGSSAGPLDTADDTADDSTADDGDSTVGLGLAAAGTAAAAGVAAAPLDGEDRPGLPDLEDAATDVSRSRIVAETTELPAGDGSPAVDADTTSPEVESVAAASADDGADRATGSVAAGEADRHDVDPDEGAAAEEPGTPEVTSGSAGHGASTTGELTPAAVGGETATAAAGRDVGRFLWLAVGALALLAFLALVLSQCGGDDDSLIGGGDEGSGVAGNDDGDGGEVGDAANVADDALRSDGARSDDETTDEAGSDAETTDDSAGGSAGTADDAADNDTDTDSTAEDSTAEDETDAGGGGQEEPASPSATTDGAAGADLQALALAALGDAGLGDLDVEVEIDGDVLRLVGDVGSQADADAAVTALEAMPILEDGMSVESALVVDTSLSGGDGDESAPEPLDGDPPYTG